MHVNINIVWQSRHKGAIKL